MVETLVRALLESGTNVIYHCGSNGVDWKWFGLHFWPELKRKYNVRVALLPTRLPTSCSLRSGPDCGTMCGVRDLVDFYCELWLDLSKKSDDVVRMKGCAMWTSFAYNFDQQWQYGQSSSRQASRRRSSCVRRAARVRRMSVLLSTEENHASLDMEFYGPFAHIRATLDYSYHKNYTHERQKLQDSIIREFLDEAIITDKNGEVCTTPTEPWIVFTAGAMGAGMSIVC